MTTTDQIRALAEQAQALAATLPPAGHAHASQIVWEVERLLSVVRWYETEKERVERVAAADAAREGNP